MSELHTFKTPLTVCIRTANRPHLLKRLLDSIVQHEPQLLQYRFEINDGSHDPEARKEGSRISMEFGRSLVRGTAVTNWLNVLDLPQAAHVMKVIGCPIEDLKAGYSVWQIYQRHEGQEIILLDDDMVFPLVDLKPSHPAVTHDDDWRCDRWHFSRSWAAMPMPLRNRGLLDCIEMAQQTVCNVLQLCTYGHGTAMDNSWIRPMQRDGRVTGDPETAEFVHYIIDQPRIMSRGYFTPTWIGKVPHVDVLPPDSADDDTIALASTDFGKVLWHPAAIGHFRLEPKRFDLRIVTDYEVLQMAQVIFHEHEHLYEQQFMDLIELLADGKRAEFAGSYRNLLAYINNVVKAEPKPTFYYKDESCEV